MFIKKDLRKIPKILEDAVVCNDDDEDGALMKTADVRDKKRVKVQEPLSELRLGRRFQEFNGSMQVLCQAEYLPKLQNLKILNLYDCGIKSLDGIGLLEACPKLSCLNLGRNPLEILPDEMSQMKSLKEIWLDDCQLSGKLPECLTHLPNLQELRLPHNQIDSLPASLLRMASLKVLNLDKNPVANNYSSDDWSGMKGLKELYLRHCGLQSLPTKFPVSLEILHVSSNPLTKLFLKDGDESGTCFEVSLPHLTHVSLNATEITALPQQMLKWAPKLVRLVLSHNPRLTALPLDIQHAIRAHQEFQSGPEIIWQPNPQLSLEGDEKSNENGSSDESDSPNIDHDKDAMDVE